MKKILCTLTITAMLGACATASDPTAMTLSSDQVAMTKSTSPLYQSVTMQGVTGGEDTKAWGTSQIGNNEFSEALANSLSASGMLATDSGNYNLVADLVSLKQPMMGIDMTVTASVTYTLTNTASGQSVYKNTISTPYTATMGDAFVGVTRLKLANEGAIRENISEFISDVTTKVDGGITPMALNKMMSVKDVITEG